MGAAATTEDLEALVARHRRELHAHCYRMLGSVHDAEDALQEVLLRAWRAQDGFQGRSSVRTWLFRIATNVCLDQLRRRPEQRILPLDAGPATDPHEGPGRPLLETVWVEPYPDAELGVEDGRAAPEARFEHREALELAFVAALQHLPATQRAVLILREVLGYSAKETATALGTTVPAVNSALQRARATLDARLPQRSQQATLRLVGDAEVRATVQRYVEAMQRDDVEAVVSMLTEDAAWSMPPLASWFGPRDQVREFLARFPLSGAWTWHREVTQANGQPAVAAYIRDEAAGVFVPFALDVLSFEGDRIGGVTAFIARATDTGDFARWPDAPAERAKVTALFERFGLPPVVAG
jgi:RNA polymerase sigma-70 factor (ECF subfamily)